MDLKTKEEVTSEIASRQCVQETLIRKTRVYSLLSLLFFVSVSNSYELRCFFVSSGCSTLYRQMSLVALSLKVLPSFVQVIVMSFTVY